MNMLIISLILMHDIFDDTPRKHRVVKTPCCQKIQKFFNAGKNHSKSLQGIFKPPKHESEHQKSLRLKIEGLRVDFPENFNIAVRS